MHKACAYILLVTNVIGNGHLRYSWRQRCREGRVGGGGGGRWSKMRRRGEDPEVVSYSRVGL